MITATPVASTEKVFHNNVIGLSSDIRSSKKIQDVYDSQVMRLKKKDTDATSQVTLAGSGCKSVDKVVNTIRPDKIHGKLFFTQLAS